MDAIRVQRKQVLIGTETRPGLQWETCLGRFARLPDLRFSGGQTCENQLFWQKSRDFLNNETKFPQFLLHLRNEGLLLPQQTKTHPHSQ
jgi:hypothetical protein